MTRITILCVNEPCEEWREKLERELDDVYDLGFDALSNSDRYARKAAEQMFLCVIHLGNRTASEAENKWVGLPAELKRNVFWLFISAGGYAQRVSWDAGHVHFLRYPMRSERLEEPEVRACFRQFIQSIEKLGSAREFTISCWEKLYPPSNIDLAALLSLLILGRLSNDYTKAQSVVRQDLRSELYRQYAGRCNFLNLDQLDEDAWQKIGGEPASMERELKRVLGKVLD